MIKQIANTCVLSNSPFAACGAVKISIQADFAGWTFCNSPGIDVQSSLSSISLSFMQLHVACCNSEGQLESMSNVDPRTNIVDDTKNWLWANRNFEIDQGLLLTRMTTAQYDSDFVKKFKYA